MVSQCPSIRSAHSGVRIANTRECKSFLKTSKGWKRNEQKDEDEGNRIRLLSGVLLEWGDLLLALLWSMLSSVLDDADDRRDSTDVFSPIEQLRPILTARNQSFRSASQVFVFLPTC